jgi:hypothetical protein
MGDKKGTTCGAYGEKRNAYRILVGKPEGKRLLDDIGVDVRTSKWI